MIAAYEDLNNVSTPSLAAEFPTDPAVQRQYVAYLQQMMVNMTDNVDGMQKVRANRGAAAGLQDSAAVSRIKNTRSIELEIKCWKLLVIILEPERHLESLMTDTFSLACYP